MRYYSALCPAREKSSIALTVPAESCLDPMIIQIGWIRTKDPGILDWRSIDFTKITEGVKGDDREWFSTSHSLNGPPIQNTVHDFQISSHDCYQPILEFPRAPCCKSDMIHMKLKIYASNILGKFRLRWASNSGKTRGNWRGGNSSLKVMGWWFHQVISYVNKIGSTASSLAMRQTIPNRMEMKTDSRYKTISPCFRPSRSVE